MILGVGCPLGHFPAGAYEVRRLAYGPKEPPERRLQASLPAPRESNHYLETDCVVARLLGWERDAQGLLVLREFEFAAVAQQFQATVFSDRKLAAESQRRGSEEHTSELQSR